MPDVSEKLFEAMTILIDKKLESVKFDETIRATIEDISNADSGEYIVTTGSAKFKAYSTETKYKKDDAVLVTIPQGNYDNQKIIIGKQVDDMNTPMIYKSPFEEIIDITTNLISGEHSWSFWANGDQYVWNDGASSITINAEDGIEINNLYHKGYTVIGLQGQFSTWLNEYDTIQGNYGLIAEVTFQEEETGDTFYNYFTLDSDEFFGDVYNFETYYTQEAIFDISEFIDYPIVKVKVMPYQRNNFLSLSGDRVPAPEDDDFSTINPNIFIKDPYICLGAFAKDFNSDTAEVLLDGSPRYYKEKTENGQTVNEKTTHTVTATQITVDLSLFEDIDVSGLTNAQVLAAKKAKVQEYLISTIPYITSAPLNTIIRGANDTIWTVTYTYSVRPYQNLKNILLRWIHKDNSTGIIKSVDEATFPAGYEVRWYRFKLGAPSPDQFAGAHWTRFYGCRATAIPDSGEWALTSTDLAGGAVDLATDSLFIQFQPNVNLASEQIKAVVLKREESSSNPGNYIYRLIAMSNVLEILNDTDVRSQATILDSNALSIKYDDDERGHYFLYNEAGDIGANEDKEIRKLIAVFDPDEDDVYLKADLVLTECSSIKWTFPNPKGNTMIVPMTSAQEDATPLTPNAQGKYVRTDVTEVGFTIKEHLNHTATDNTILLEVVKDGQNYMAQVQPIFGTAGTNGSDYTVILSWRNGKNAINLSESEVDKTLIGDVVIYDQAGNVLPWPEDSKIECTWEVAYYGEYTEKEQEKEEPGVCYPIIRSTNRLNSADYCFDYVENAGSPGYINPSDYYIYDLNQKKFVKPADPSAVSVDTDILYAKTQFIGGTDTRKPKLNFKEVSFTNEPYEDEETGTLCNIAGTTVNGVSTPDSAIEGSGANKVYRYSTRQRYFIKYDNVYILDPWDTYQENETYYEPVEVPASRYVVYPDANGNNVRAGYLTVTATNDGEERYVTITPDQYSISMDQFYILKLIVTNFGDYDLVTYYPVPMKNGETVNGAQKTFIVDYIEGPDRVRYGSSGETDFNKNPYKIVTRKYENNNFTTYRHGYKEDTTSLDGYWRIIYSDSNAQDSNFKASLVENVIDPNTGKPKEVTNGKYDIPTLAPVGVYIPTAANYAVQFCIQKLELITNQNVFNQTPTVYNAQGEEITKGNWAANTYYRYVVTVLWTQPILVYQNKYPSRTLNKWNGKDIQTDDKAGTITASGFAAGKKEEDDNSFTGVIIGDWSRSVADACITKNTGIYGFNHGAMAYAFKDDGTGFIGKDGSGRLYFNGDKSQIYSNNWLGNTNQGMLLDIDDGYIKMQKLAQLADNYSPVNIWNAKDSFRTQALKYKTFVGKNDLEKVFTKDPQYDAYSELANNAGYDETVKYYKYRGDNYILLNYRPIAVTQSNYSPGTYYIENNGEFILANAEQFSAYPENTKFYVSSDEVYDYFTTALTYGIHQSEDEKLYISDNGYTEVGQYDEYDENGNYYKHNDADTMRYITMGSNQRTVPLSIGEEKAVLKRAFRVDWDGTTHIANGDIAGRITAKVGKIGGWIIDEPEIRNTEDSRYATVILDSYKGSIMAQKGKIGGWNISYGALYDGEVPYLAEDGGDSTTVLRAYGGGIESVFGKIGGWRISQTALVSKDGQTILYAEEDRSFSNGVYTVNTPNIVTNVIRMRGDGSEVADFGLVIGHNGQNYTTQIGIRALNTGIIIEGTDNIGIKSQQNIYIQNKYNITTNVHSGAALVLSSPLAGGASNVFIGAGNAGTVQNNGSVYIGAGSDAAESALLFDVKAGSSTFYVGDMKFDMTGDFTITGADVITIGGNELQCTVPKEEQYGIYARFG